jgi:hypothetical protein
MNKLLSFVQLCFHAVAVIFLCLAGELPMERVREVLRQLVREAYADVQVVTVPVVSVTTFTVPTVAPPPVPEEEVARPAEPPPKEQEPRPRPERQVAKPAPAITPTVKMEKTDQRKVATQVVHRDRIGVGEVRSTLPKVDEDAPVLAKPASAEVQTPMLPPEPTATELLHHRQLLKTPIRLKVRLPTGEVKIHDFDQPEPIVIGSGTADVGVEHGSVGPSQCLIRPVGGGKFKIRHSFLGGGTTVNGKPLSLNEDMELLDNDVIGVGDVTILVQFGGQYDFTALPHVDPTPTVARGVDLAAVAQAEIASQPPVPKRKVCSAGERLDPEQARVNYAWALFSRLKGTDSEVFYQSFLPKVPPIPLTLFEEEHGHKLIALVVPPSIAPFNRLLEAADAQTILDEGHVDPEPADVAKAAPYWMRCQHGTQYRSIPMRQVLGSVNGSKERILTPREALCLSLQYPSVLPEDGSHAMELLAGTEITLLLTRKGKQALLEDAYLDDVSEIVGVATRVVPSGQQPLTH